MANFEGKKTCPVCGGTGQVSYFKGVSRFLLSADECEACAGTGYELDSEDQEAKKDMAGKAKKRRLKKK